MSVIRQLGKAVFATCDRLLPSPRGPRILIYHQIGARLGRQMEVTVSDFERQLDWLKENRLVVTLAEALRRWEEAGSEDLVVLTFDDGYADTYSTAFPLMRERGLPFTLYLATASIETGEGYPQSQPLNWEQVGEMLSTGLVTVGAHTHNHTDLRTLTPDAIARELDTSNQLIESRLGVFPAHFAYPWGYWSAQADIAIRRLYESAVLGSPSIRRLGELDEYLVHRFPVQLSDGFVWFRSRLRGGFLMEEAVRRLLRNYRGPRGWTLKRSPARRYSSESAE